MKSLVCLSPYGDRLGLGQSHLAPPADLRKTLHGQETHRSASISKITYEPGLRSGLDSDFFCESFEGRGKFE